MRRRPFLSLTGTLLAGAGGCLTTRSTTSTPPTNDDDLPPDDNPRDGYPPGFGDPPTARVIDPASFQRTRVNPRLYENIGNLVEVPLAPIDITYYWYRRREARFIDARSTAAFDRSHIYGAVSSPAPDGTDNDPAAEWPKTDRIVCYCGCPHHVSSIRAAVLLEAGYEDVYVIDEGFWEWDSRNYPMAGAEITHRPRLRVIDGVVDPAFAGQTALAYHEPSGQLEAARVGDDGTYRLELRFYDVFESSPIVIETPEYRVEGSLAEFTSTVVRGPV